MSGIEEKSKVSSLNHRLFLDYTYGLDRIYTLEEIQLAKQSPSFEIEYNLKYLGLIGNVFHIKDIEAAIEKGKKLYSLLTSTHIKFIHTKVCLQLDPAYSHQIHTHKSL